MSGNKHIRNTIITLGSVAGAVSAILILWGSWGWVPKNAYAEDHKNEQTVMDVLESIQTSVGEIKTEQTKQGAIINMNHAEWVCDEVGEEVDDLAVTEDERELSASEEVRKDRLKEQWTALQCSQFKSNN